jgi:hypothetical protein
VEVDEPAAPEPKTAFASSVLQLILNPFSGVELAKTPPTCQTNSPPARIADSSSRNAVSFSSARTTNRFPSAQCVNTPAVSSVRPIFTHARLLEAVASWQGVY